MARSDLKDRRRRCFVDLQQAEQDLAAARKDHDLAVAGEAPVARLRELAARITAFEVDVTALERRRDLLAAEATKVDTAAAEQARTEAIDRVLQPQADVIGDLADKLETKLGELSGLYAELVAAEKQLYAKWPAAVPHDKFYRWTLNDVRQRLSGAAGYAAANSDFARFAMWANTFGERTTSLSVSVRKSLASYLANLKVQPLPAPKKVATEEVI